MVSLQKSSKTAFAVALLGLVESSSQMRMFRGGQDTGMGNRNQYISTASTDEKTKRKRRKSTAADQREPIRSNQLTVTRPQTKRLLPNRPIKWTTKELSEWVHTQTDKNTANAFQVQFREAGASGNNMFGMTKEKARECFDFNELQQSQLMCEVYPKFIKQAQKGDVQDAKLRHRKTANAVQLLQLKFRNVGLPQQERKNWLRVLPQQLKVSKITSRGIVDVGHRTQANGTYVLQGELHNGRAQYKHAGLNSYMLIYKPEEKKWLMVDDKKKTLSLKDENGLGFNMEELELDGFSPVQQNFNTWSHWKPQPWNVFNDQESCDEPHPEVEVEPVTIWQNTNDVRVQIQQGPEHDEKQQEQGVRPEKRRRPSLPSRWNTEELIQWVVENIEQSDSIFAAFVQDLFERFSIKGATFLSDKAKGSVYCAEQEFITKIRSFNRAKRSCNLELFLQEKIQKEILPKLRHEEERVNSNLSIDISAKEKIPLQIKIKGITDDRSALNGFYNLQPECDCNGQRYWERKIEGGKQPYIMKYISMECRWQLVRKNDAGEFKCIGLRSQTQSQRYSGLDPTECTDWMLFSDDWNDWNSQPEVSVVPNESEWESKKSEYHQLKNKLQQTATNRDKDAQTNQDKDTQQQSTRTPTNTRDTSCNMEEGTFQSTCNMYDNRSKERSNQPINWNYEEVCNWLNRTNSIDKQSANYYKLIIRELVNTKAGYAQDDQLEQEMDTDQVKDEDKFYEEKHEQFTKEFSQMVGSMILAESCTAEFLKKHQGMNALSRDEFLREVRENLIKAQAEGERLDEQAQARRRRRGSRIDRGSRKDELRFCNQMKDEQMISMEREIFSQETIQWSTDDLCKWVFTQTDENSAIIYQDQFRKFRVKGATLEKMTVRKAYMCLNLNNLRQNKLVHELIPKFLDDAQNKAKSGQQMENRRIATGKRKNWKSIRPYDWNTEELIQWVMETHSDKIFAAFVQDRFERFSINGATLLYQYENPTYVDPKKEGSDSDGPDADLEDYYAMEDYFGFGNQSSKKDTQEKDSDQSNMNSTLVNWLKVDQKAQKRISDEIAKPLYIEFHTNFSLQEDEETGESKSTEKKQPKRKLPNHPKDWSSEELSEWIGSQTNMQSRSEYQMVVAAHQLTGEKVLADRFTVDILNQLMIEFYDFAAYDDKILQENFIRDVKGRLQIMQRKAEHQDTLTEVEVNAADMRMDYQLSDVDEE